MSENCLHCLLQPQRKTSSGSSSSSSMRLRRLSQPTPPRQRKPPEGLLGKRCSLGQEERRDRGGGNDNTPSRRRRSTAHRRYTLTTLALCQLPSDASSPSSTASSSPTDFSESFFRSTRGAERRSSGARGSPWYNLRRAWSLISVSCWRETLAREERRKELKEAKMLERKGKGPKGILRAPTKYCYHRGVSGLPVTCRAPSNEAGRNGD
ncbi:uncharacterized protein LOC123519307 [Portunus trituberculatus]|uniref:uncharacterized protein LOC123519307 n=1 Tax=Portunus trituberculatus TaxID=210409 RepID=UPI001E1CCADA|nr:uncharacterized protein LOC123519307 [Portunus trituberculatus]